MHPTLRHPHRQPEQGYLVAERIVSVALKPGWPLILLCALYALPALSHTTAPLRLFAAKSAVDSGVVAMLLEDFGRRHPEIPVTLRSAGALEVIDQAKRGAADIIITHHAPAEEQFITDGFGSHRAQIMYSEYALLGPPGQLPELQHVENIVEALKLLAAQEVDFVVPSPRSGTYRKISELWVTAGIDPKWPGYENTGVSGLATLRQAASVEAYTITDMGTYFARRHDLDDSIVPLRHGEVALRNIYSALVINSQKIAGAHEDSANILFNYLIGDEAQKLVRAYSEKTFGSTFLTPAADLDSGLRLQRQQRQLADKEAQLHRTNNLLIAIVISACAILLLIVKIRHDDLRRIATEKVNQQVASRLDVAEQSAKERNQFFASVTHELRTPLNAVLGYSDLMTEIAQEKGHAEYLPDLNKISRSGKHLLTIINDILDLAKIDSGNMSLHYETVDVAELVSQLENIMTPVVNKNGNHLVTRIESTVTNIVTDATRLMQILANIIGNSAKFTNNGEISLTVKPLANARILFTLEDTGIGITPEQMSRLFIPFQQAEKSTTKMYGGTGLGLAICLQLVQQMNGTITVDSEVSRGTRFSIELPVEGGDTSRSSREG